MHPPARTDAGEILVTWPDFDVALHGPAFAARGLVPRLEPKRGTRTPEELRSLAADAVGAIVSTDPFDAEVLAATPSLRVIARVGVGVDSIDLEAATAHGVVVTVTPGANEATVADHTLTMMLAAVRRVVEHDAGVRGGGWDRTGALTPGQLSGSTVGLVGYGRIGRLVAERLHGFGVEVLAADPAVSAADGDVELLPLAELLARADVVSLHCPLLPQTRDLIGAAELAAMRPDAIVVNTSRGGLIDEEALADALEQGRLSAAALDVFAAEPPHGSRLLALPNVLLSPHVAGLSERSIQEMTRRATASVVDVIDGRQPRHVANPEVLERLGLQAAAAPADADGAHDA
ncbi:MAG TPA: phosphoglycerate dehydrogenase [Conexibacter sp.]|nr:phosphoglycerate dehydrogenase [Conexibacter sp.]